MILAAIVATDLNNAIGKNNKLLWHLPADLNFFKTTTMGCPIIMGRKTFESIGHVLPGRRNIVISRTIDYELEDAEIFNSIDSALASCNEEKVFIIGGAEIYKQTLSRCKLVYRTLVKEIFEGDTFFPDLEDSEFKLDWEEHHADEKKNKYDYCFQKWVRK
jgi:dihydrofolate reductase